MHKDSQQSSRALYFRLLGYVRPYRVAFVVAMICMALTAIIEPAFPALMKTLLDTGFGQKGDTDLRIFPVLVVVIFGGRGIIGFVGDYAMAWAANHVVADLRNAMFARLVTLPTRFFDDQSSGALMSKVAYDVTGVTQAATTVATVLVRDSLTVIGLLAWLMYLNWALTLVALVMIPLIAFSVRLFSRRLRIVSRSAQRSMGLITHVLEETIGAHKVVKIFGGEQYESQRFAAANSEQRGHNMRSTVAAAGQGPIVQVFAAVALATIIAVAINQSGKDVTTVGSFVSFMTAMLMLLAPMKRLADLNASLQRGLAAAESVFELIDEPAEDDKGVIELGRVRGEVEFANVNFIYPEAMQPALEGIDIRIAPGETVALVGQSGSGKTTVANLLPRFYHTTGGRILIDGYGIEDIKLASLRRNIALVSQDVVLFNDTVAANIAYGADPGITHDLVLAAATAAHALDFIEAMPMGFDTLIGENGVKMSGGQRQRIAIARALLKDAPILILDEATSALDTESERHVQAALETLMQGRTTLVIAHRLSTVERADRILVLGKGRIVEQGNHEGLLARNGIYAQLYRLQFEQGE
jgi:subfamily B ATP-binding cassette protein MsbA